MTNKNTIYIIGAGAIGKALAVVLMQNGKDVVLVRGSVDDGSTRLSEISVELGDGKKYIQSITTTSLSRIKRFDGIVLLTNKSFGNEQLANKLTEMSGRFPVVILQNGLNVEDRFLNLDFYGIYRCVLFATGQVVGGNTVVFKQVVSSPVGVVKGNAKTLAHIVSFIHTSDFKFHSTVDIQTIVWKKAIMNTVFNSVCPLLDVDNGIFHRDKAIFEFVRSLIIPCVGVAKATGIEITVPEIEEGLLQISQSSDGQLISTLQDIRNGRPTEIESLNFEIVKVAESLQMQSVTSEIAMLGELIKIKAYKNMQYQHGGYQQKNA